MADVKAIDTDAIAIASIHLPRCNRSPWPWHLFAPRIKRVIQQQTTCHKQNKTNDYLD